MFLNQTISVGLTADHAISGIVDPDYPAGGTVGDFDADGFQDILWLSGGDGGQADKLFMNNGDGTFTDEAAARGVAAVHKGKGACTWDYDDDGDLDIYVVSNGPAAGQAPGHHKLYQNDGTGHFTDVAAAAGVAFTVTTNPADGWSASPNDYDLDGDLDLIVGGSRPGNVGTKLFRNDGDGTFTDVTGSAGTGGGWLFDGIALNVYGFSPRFADVNGDRWPELLFVADFGTSRFFRNNGDGTFTDWTVPSGAAKEENGMGSSLGDYNRDGRIDWYATSIFLPQLNWTGNKMYINFGNFSLVDVAIAAGVADGGYGWGAVSVDFNHDRWQDIAETNGGGCPSSFCNEQSYLWMADGDNTFTERALASGFNHSAEGRAFVNFDLENDGDQDIAIFANNGPFRFFRNDLPAAANTHWLRVFLDTQAHPHLAPHGIGARVVLQAGGVTQYRWIEAAFNFLSTSELSAHFGLGTATTVDLLRVEWPDGTVTELTDLAADQTLTVSSGQWTELEFAKAGVAGFPALGGTGPLTGSSANQVDLTNAAPSSSATLVFGVTAINAPFKQGTMVPHPLILVPMATDPGGATSLPFVFPDGIPAGLELFFQFWISDPAATVGFAASNGLRGLTP